MSFDPVRRVVTGHSPDGDSIIESDQQLTPRDIVNASNPATAEHGGFTTIWRTSSHPAEVQGEWEELHGSSIPLATDTGTTVRIVDFGPGACPMHRTISIDFGVVLEGEVELVMDHGVTTRMKKHDIVVQRGTLHAWRNIGEGLARMMFVLVPSKPVKIGGEELGNDWRPEEPEDVSATFKKIDEKGS